jgi:hypothetical protein
MAVPNWPRRTALYRLFDAADDLLYIGVSYDPRDRGYQHVMTKTWWRDTPDQISRLAPPPPEDDHSG